MKVLHLIGGGDVGGAKSHVLSLLSELKNNISVKLISFRSGMFADDAKNLDIDVDVISSKNIIKDFRSLLKIVKENNFDIVHCHGAKANMMGVFIKLLTKKPIVTTVHSDYKLDYLHSMLKRCTFGVINTFALKFFDHYICVSSSIQNLMLDRGFNSLKVHKVNNGIDFKKTYNFISRNEFLQKYHIKASDSDTLVGILARLTPVKGIDIFIDAANIVLKKRKDIIFLIAGDGEQKQELEQKVKALGLTSNIHFIGYVTETDEFLHHIDINVLSSLSEGFPYSIIEGARQSKATISSYVGGIPDLIKHKHNGMLFTSGDFSALANFMMELSDDTALLELFGKNLYDDAKTEFSIETMYTNHLKIYKNVLE